VRAFVSGGTGFVGGRLVEALLEKNFEVACLARETSDTKHLEGLGVELVVGDLLRPSSFRDSLGGCDLAVHAAGVLGGWGIPERVFFETHVEGTRKLAEAAAESKVKRFIHVSSAGVSGPTGRKPASEESPIAPSNVYERSKAEAEEVLSAFREKMGVTILRPEFVYGPRDTHVLGLFKAVKAGYFPLIGGGGSLVHPTFIEDVAAALAGVLASPDSVGQTYLVAGEKPVTVKEFCGLIARELGVAPPRLSIPKPAASALAALLEPLGRALGFEPPLTRARVKFFTLDRAFDSSKARRELGYNPALLAEGVKETVGWYQKNGLL